MLQVSVSSGLLEPKIPIQEDSERVGCRTAVKDEVYDRLGVTDLSDNLHGDVPGRNIRQLFGHNRTGPVGLQPCSLGPPSLPHRVNERQEQLLVSATGGNSITDLEQHVVVELGQCGEVDSGEKVCLRWHRWR